MRILYVCSDFGVPVYGHKGASIHVRAMARAFADLGHTLRILSPATERVAHHDFDVPVADPVAMQRHEATLGALRRADRQLGRLGSGHTARVTQEVRNLLLNEELGRSAEAWRGFEPDFVYERYALFGFGGLELARGLGVPHMLEVNAPLCLEQERARGLHLGDLARAIEQRTWRETGALLAVSDELRTVALDQGASPERVHVLPNGVDATRFIAAPDSSARLRAELGLGSGPVLGFVGSLKSWHGVEVLLAAFAALYRRRPDCRLLLVGDGPMAEELQRSAQAHGVQAAMCMTGAVDHARVPDYLAAMDVAVAPYLPADDFYFSPIKVYEYMAAGKPVVASRLGQITPLAAADLLWAVEPGDPAALEQALETVLASTTAAAARAARGREWVLSERTWAANARRVLDIAAACSAART
jgi:glycosyltransferase involved in cell wall biosynthesis